MNSKINGYVNYLLDNAPSPFCEYILMKEFLPSDELAIRDAYDWAVRFRLYEELQCEQFPDGSWGGVWDSVTSLSKGRHYKTINQAMQRMLDLGLDIHDPMVNSTINICRQYLSGEAFIPNFRTMGKNNTDKPVILRRSLAQWIACFVPDDPFAVDLCQSTAKRLEVACLHGRFDREEYRRLDISLNIADYSYESLYALSSGNYISNTVQRAWLSYEWDNPLWHNALKPAVLWGPDSPHFHFWLIRLENLKNFTLFGEFMEGKTADHLYSICDRLCDECSQFSIKSTNYPYHYGQYTESPRNKQHKKKDLLLRIIRLLNKCA